MGGRHLSGDTDRGRWTWRGWVSAIVIGIVIGVLGRLVVPGRQHIGILWTILVGIVAALDRTGRR